MNRPIFYTAVFLFTQLILHAALAQSGQTPKTLNKYSVWLQPNQNQQVIYPMPDSLLAKKGLSQNQLYIINPNTLLQKKNKAPLALYSFPDSLIANPNHIKPFAVRPNAFKFAPADPNAGSLDPGIFYNPDEPAEPAAAIIKPLKNVDPKMAINPDKN